MKTIPIKQVQNDTGLANVPDYEGVWPPKNAIGVISDASNYTVYEIGDEATYADYLASLPSVISVPEITLEDKMQKIVDFAKEQGIEF